MNTTCLIRLDRFRTNEAPLALEVDDAVDEAWQFPRGIDTQYLLGGDDVCGRFGHDRVPALAERFERSGLAAPRCTGQDVPPVHELPPGRR